MKRWVAKILEKIHRKLVKFHRDQILDQALALPYEDFVILLGKMAAERELKIYLMDRNNREQRIRLLHDLLVELDLQACITSRLGQADAEIVEKIVSPMKEIAKQAKWN